MAEALICACGAAVPAGRPRCGRCGGRGNKAASAERRERRSWPMQASAIGGAIVLAAAALAMMGAPRRSLPAAQVAAPSTTLPTPEQNGRREAGAFAPAPVFAGADAARAGVAAYNNGDVAAAVTQFTGAVERDPNNAEALNNLGLALVRTGRTREAIPNFDRAIAIADGVWSYHFNRAKAYGDLKEWRQAIAGYREAARLFPDDYVTQFNLARALQADGDLPGALQAYAKATEFAPAQADFHLWYGQALDQSDKRQEAAVEYRRFLELDPKASQAEKVRARLSELAEAPTPSS